MNIKDYISSGMVESYVLGLASEEERVEFEQLCLRHPELVAARNDFEAALETYLLSGTPLPVIDVKEKVMIATKENSPAAASKVITMENRNIRSSSPLRWVAAAAVILLLVSAYFAFSFYSKNRELETELAKARDTQTEMDERLKSLAEMEERVKKLEMVSDPNVAVVNLKGTEKAPASSASVYWDSASSNVYLVVKNMPKLPSDKQYQLWSLINAQDGSMQPTSLGLFDIGDDKKVILKMDKAQKADAFAITIENRGNKEGPTLDQLQSMGKTGL